jgi:hypothetical protein
MASLVASTATDGAVVMTHLTRDPPPPPFPSFTRLRLPQLSRLPGRRPLFPRCTRLSSTSSLTPDDNENSTCMPIRRGSDEGHTAAVRSLDALLTPRPGN